VEPVQPLTWMRLLRDHTPKPPANSARFAVLWALALRMKSNGTGFASVSQLSGDIVVHERTVKRHLKWAREAKFLEQTRRGHRVTAELSLASEYALIAPTQGDMGVPLGGDPRGQTGAPKVTDLGTQGDMGVTPRGLSSGDPHPSARAADVSAGAALRAHHRERVVRRNGTTVIPLKECPGCERMFRPPSPRWEDGVYCRECLGRTTRRGRTKNQVDEDTAEPDTPQEPQL
jgi:hypothetical protein